MLVIWNWPLWRYFISVALLVIGIVMAVTGKGKVWSIVVMIILLIASIVVFCFAWMETVSL